MTGSTILFDSRWVGPHGIGRFASELQDRLPGLKLDSMSGRPTGSLDPLKLSWKLWRDGDAFFSPGFNAPLSLPMVSSRPFVFVIHDLIHVNYPGEASLLKRLYYDRVVRPAARRAFKVLTVSEYSKREIVDWSGVSPDKVEVVYNGVGNEFSTEGEARKSDRPYILYVGNQKPHKNVDSLLAAMPEVLKTADVRLAISGTPSEMATDQIRKHGLEGNVEFLGKLTDEELAAAYRGAEATVLPSEYEGFGLPVIESMACGTPVVCSNATSLPEVAGDAAVLVGTDRTSIADGIVRVLTNESLRVDLRKLGLERASQFSWESTAEKVQNVLTQLAQVASAQEVPVTTRPHAVAE